MNFFIKSSLFKVKATDADEGPAAQIEYSIYETDNNGITELFGINKITGGISLLKSAKTYGKISSFLISPF